MVLLQSAQRILRVQSDLQHGVLRTMKVLCGTDIGMKKELVTLMCRKPATSSPNLRSAVLTASPTSAAINPFLRVTRLVSSFILLCIMDVNHVTKHYGYVTQEEVMKLINHPHITEQDVQKFYTRVGPELERVFGTTELFSEIDTIVAMSVRHEKLKNRKAENTLKLGLYFMCIQYMYSQKEILKIYHLLYLVRFRFIIETSLLENRCTLMFTTEVFDDADNISPSGGYLTLGWPDSMNNYTDLWVTLHRTTIEVDLSLIIGNVVVPFAQDFFLVEGTTEGDFEELRSKQLCTTTKLCSATLSYIAMPFGALCKVRVRFSSRDEGLVVNLAGKIVARYKNTCGNYNSEPCVLFEKKNGFEAVNMKERLCMSRRWLGLHAYSSLEIDLDLTDFNTGKKLANKTVEVFCRDEIYAGECAVDVGGFAIVVDASLFPFPHCGWSDWDNVKYDNKSFSSKNGNPRSLDQDRESILRPSDLVEFYSLFIGCKTMGTALNIIGTVEFSSDNNTHYLFQRMGDDGVEVEDSQKVLPLNDVYTLFDECSTLEMKVNLEDVGGKFQNRGFATYGLGSRPHRPFYNTQICSVFPGKEGFCALNYSLLSRACQANIEIIFKIKSDHSGVDKIYGSAVTRYSNFDYSTKFMKDYFQSVLFKRTEKDSVGLKDNGRVPLSRCKVAVPIDSSLIIEVDFCGMSLTNHLFCMKVFEIGCCSFKTETNDYKLRINLTWSDGLRYEGSDSDEDKMLTPLPTEKFSDGIHWLSWL
ncbi:unnamed protein product [Cuscuta campestris]|uniref:DUF6598 domain-containing protein n=1 Tax=Cuscuta campestris TaxID=132261 RepID=A0A484L1Q3_9ASTE|nr:unnamed protein product [Cuscuta campestris]